MAKVSKERKIAYYIGMGMIVLGFILFISTFFDVARFMNNPFFGDISTNDSIIDTYTYRHHSHMGSGISFTKSVIGMVLIIAGFLIMNVGARGKAGSGLILDPQKAREDLKPFNEAKGGMISDVIRNIDLVDRIIQPNEGKEVVKIRCRSCKSLNDEDAKYCKKCGKEL
ncbi:MAG: zinc ribbon domain-containing protein [Caldicoprobacterales bacterium]